VAQGTLRELSERLGDWFLRKQALRHARAQLPRPGQPAARAFEQVQLLREVARQVAEPVEKLSYGRTAAVLLSLHRELVYWTLVAELNGTTDAPPDLASVWQRVPSPKLLRAAGNAAALESVRGTLMDLTPTAALDATDEDVARVRAFADAIYQELDEPRRRLNRVLVRRWLHLSAVAAAVLIITFAIRAYVRGPNLAAGKPFRTSSKIECADDGCRAQLFHTGSEASPWVEFDLGKPTPVHLIDVYNRDDCCQERAVPLVAEISNDRVKWRQVARRETQFATWTATFPRTPARYVRLRVDNATVFHLKDVVIR
jgi:hypothetical protein